MIAIIPAKVGSNRVPNKNFRPFYDDKSLCDLQIEKLLKVIPKEKIYLSSEDPLKEKIASNYGIHFLLREERLVDNNTPIDKVIREIYKQTGSNEDVAWCQVINPLFNDYEMCFSTWEKLVDKSRYDSFVVAYKASGYLLDDQCQPINFMYGPWHLPSQKLRPMYELNFTLSILSRATVCEIGYYIGKKPYWYLFDKPHIDIDTEDDFALAQIMYRYYKEKGNLIL